MLKMTKFVDEMIAGGNVYNPVEGGVEGGKFVGYVVDFGHDPEYSDKSHLAVVDEFGKSVMNVESTFIYAAGRNVLFEIKRPEVLWHSVAFKSMSSQSSRARPLWTNALLSDTQLGFLKTTFSAYVILESWYE